MDNHNENITVENNKRRKINSEISRSLKDNNLFEDRRELIYSTFILTNLLTVLLSLTYLILLIQYSRKHNENLIVFGGCTMKLDTLLSLLYWSERNGNFHPKITTLQSVYVACYTLFETNEHHLQIIKQVVERAKNQLVNKKCTIWSVISNINMMRYMCGVDIHEFESLFQMIYPDLQNEFPFTKLDYEDSYKGKPHFTLRLILYLFLHYSKHGSSMRYLSGLTGFSKSAINHRINSVEKILLNKNKLFKNKFRNAFIYPPSLVDLKAAALYNFDVGPVYGGKRLALCAWNDCCYSLIPTPNDSNTQESFYSGYKKLHAMKISVMCAADGRKWIFEANPVQGRTSDLMAGKESKLYQTIANIKGLYIGADKGLIGDEKFVTPYKNSQILKAVKGLSAQEKQNKINEMCNYNFQFGQKRVIVECVIGDLSRWAIFRGSNDCKKHRNRNDHEGYFIQHQLDRIQIAVGLTNFLYRCRNLG